MSHRSNLVLWNQDGLNHHLCVNFKVWHLLVFLLLYESTPMLLLMMIIIIWMGESHPCMSLLYRGCQSHLQYLLMLVYACTFVTFEKREYQCVSILNIHNVIFLNYTGD